MAAAAIMVTSTPAFSSPSALVGGETMGNETELTIKNESSDPKTELTIKADENPNCQDSGENCLKENESIKSESKSSSAEKPVEYSDTSKKPPRMSSVDDYTMLPEGYVPKDEDVICSWARQNHSHPGNEKFRIMINEYAPTYLNVSTKYQKSEVIAKIVAEVRSKSPGGGFVKKDFYSNRWFEVGDEKARDKVGHAIRKAAVGLGKKLNGNKPQSTFAKRRMKNKASEFDQGNSLNMNPSDFLNKAALMSGMNMDNGFSGLPNEMGLNMGALNRNALMGVSGMRNTSGLMGAMGMNGVGMGMNGGSPMSYSRELEEMLVMNRLRSEVSAPSDSTILGMYGNGKSASDASGLTGLNMMAGMDDSSAMLEELQRRKLRYDAAAKKEEAMHMLRESDQMSRWADTNNKPGMNDPTMDFNSNTSNLNNMNHGGVGNNRPNFMSMSGLGGIAGNLDNMNTGNLDSLSTSTLLSKLAAGKSDQLFMRGTSNFGNNGGMSNSLMNLNNNESMGDCAGQLPIANNGLGPQSLNQMPDQYNSYELS